MVKEYSEFAVGAVALAASNDSCRSVLGLFTVGVPDTVPVSDRSVDALTVIVGEVKPAVMEMVSPVAVAA